MRDALHTRPQTRVARARAVAAPRRLARHTLLVPMLHMPMALAAFCLVLSRLLV